MLVFAVLLPEDQKDSGMAIVEDNNHQVPLGIIRFTEKRGPPRNSNHSSYQLLAKTGTRCLESYVDVTKCYARNHAFGFPWSNLLVGDTMIGLKSDVDDQLVIQLAFRTPVKVRDPTTGAEHAVYFLALSPLTLFFVWYIGLHFRFNR